MDEAEVKALLAATLAEFGKTMTTEIMGQVNQANSGLAASIQREMKKALEGQPQKTEQPEQPAGTDGAESGRLTLRALQNQLEEQKKLIGSLTEETQRKEAEAFTARKNSALAQAIAAQKVLNPKALQKLLQVDFGDALKEENGQWFVSQGDQVKGLEDSVAGYLQTDEGKAFVLPSGTQGAGSVESKPVVVTADKPASKATDALMNAF